MAVFSKYTNVVLTPFLTGGLQLHEGAVNRESADVYLSIQCLSVHEK